MLEATMTGASAFQVRAPGVSGERRCGNDLGCIAS